jgi:hypothetical protein
MQTTSTSFSCAGFDKLRDEQIVKGVYTCRSDEQNPGGLGTNVGSSGNSTRGTAGTFNVHMPTYSIFGLVAFLFVL